jgi:hypothetical protein
MHLMLFVLLHIYHLMFFKAIATIAVTVPILILATQTSDRGGRPGRDGIAIPLTKRSDTDVHEFNATSHDA